MQQARDRRAAWGILAILAVSVLACSPRAGAPPAAPAAAIDWTKAQRIDVIMVEYRFIPDHLTLQRGVP